MQNSQPDSPRSLSYQIARIFFIVAFIPTAYGDLVDGCFKNSEYNYGRTFPAGDIFLEPGQPLELFCSINLEKAKADNFSVEDLVFKKDDQIIEPSYITRLNETTIRLYIETQQNSAQMYYCYLQKTVNTESNLISTDNNTSVSSSTASSSTVSKIVCLNWVTVKFLKPLDVKHFTCISLNWEALNCSWQVPKNSMPTSYTIVYSPKHRYIERKACPTASDLKENTCLWTLRSDPIYRKNFDVLRFAITGTNKYGSNEQAYFFNHFAHVLMDGPKDLQIQAKNSTSVTLQGTIGDLQYFPKPIDYKIEYSSATDSEWRTILFLSNKDNMRNSGQHISWTIPDLTPDMQYQCRVLMKSSQASNKYWSTNYTSLTFYTDLA